MHLFAAFLGGELAASRMGEDHEVVFVVAEDMRVGPQGGQGEMGRRWPGLTSMP